MQLYSGGVLEALHKGFVTLFIWSIEDGWPIKYVSDNVVEILGYDPHQLLSEKFSYSQLVHPDDLARIQKEVSESIANREPSLQSSYRLITKSGTVRWVKELSIFQRNTSGHVISIVGYIHDDTDTKHAEESLIISELIKQHSREAIMVTDEHGIILSVNPTFCRVTGYTQDEILGLRPSIMSSGHHDKKFYQAMWKNINEEGHWQGEILDRRKNGEVYPKWLSIHTAYDEQGCIFRRVAIFSDISKQKQSEELIWRHTNFDTITKLPNKQFLSLRLNQEIVRIKQTKKSLALIYLDLDNFRAINDSFGYLAGDELLFQIAKRLTSTLRTNDIVARHSSGEFVLLIVDLKDQYGIERVAMKVRNAFDHPFQVNGELIYTSACFGITICPEDSNNSEQLMKNAEQAMFFAKRRGKGRYQFFTQSMQFIAERRMKLAKDIRLALQEQQLYLVYQPIIDLEDNSISKIEVLIRWDHPEIGNISPVEFISIAEDIGLISDIGDWVFRNAVIQLENWRNLVKTPLQMSINTSPAQYRDDTNRIKQWVRFLEEHSIETNSISLEITEGMLMESNTDIETCLLLIRDSGIEVALDDFGTGYSSLSYLKRMSIDFLKIDRSFVQNLEPDSDDLALCEAIIAMAHRLGIRVVAEGIETDQQKDLLKAAGCDYGQGYFFYRPLSQEQMHAVLS